MVAGAKGIADVEGLAEQVYKNTMAMFWGGAGQGGAGEGTQGAVAARGLEGVSQSS